MKKTYIIRKIAYFYTDEYYVQLTIGGIEKLFDSKEEAYKTFYELERKAYENVGIGYYEQFSGDDMYKENIRAFEDFCTNKLGKEIIKTDEHGFEYFDFDADFIRELSNDDLFTIRDILGLKFYELSVFVGEPIFFGIWLNDEKTLLGGDETPYFANTYQEALTMVEDKGVVLFAFKDKIFEGSFEELSDQPQFLKSLVYNSRTFTYDDAHQKLSIKELNNKDLLDLNHLLKQKVFELKTIPFDQVKDIKTEDYQYP